MACPITVAKFVGTISLGLLTGVSYSVSNIALPALQALPTASDAANTLGEIRSRTRSRILRLSNVAAISLVTAFSLSSPRRKHPYLIWTSLVALVGGTGLEWWTDPRALSASVSSTLSCALALPSQLASRLGGKRENVQKDKKFEEDASSSTGAGSEIEIVEESEARSDRASTAPTPSQDGADVNGESVEREMSRDRRIQNLRTWVLGLGFSMGVVGIWGEGA